MDFNSLWFRMQSFLERKVNVCEGTRPIEEMFCEMLLFEEITVYKVVYSAVNGRSPMACILLKRMVSAEGIEPSTY